MAKNVENEWIRNNWENTPNNVLSVWHTALVVFNTACAGACEWYRTPFPSRPETLSFLHVTWCNHVITRHTTTKHRRNTYQKEMIPLLHFMWPNHTKVNKAKARKVALMKGNYSYRTRDLWLCDILINEEHQITTFTKP